MPPLVFVVDDNPIVTELVKLRLTLAGYTVEGASDGLAALRRLRELQPALILLDLDMPVLGGLETLKIIRAEDLWRDARIVMLTASDDDANIAAAHRLGADGYLLKPFDSNALAERVNRLLGARDTVWMDDEHCVVRSRRA